MTQEQAQQAQPTGEPETGQGASQPVTRRRRGGSAADMVRSLVVVLALVAVVLVVTPRPGGESIRVVDYTAALQTARISAPFDVLAPTRLPEGWRAVRADVDSGDGRTVVWRLGLITPEGRYVTLEQSSGAHGPLVRRETAGGHGEGAVTVRGAEWARLVRGPDQRSLLRKEPQAWTLVTGNAAWADLQRLASTLGAQPAPAR